MAIIELASRGEVKFTCPASTATRSVRATVGMGAYTVPDLRHFFASGLIAHGCDVVTV